MTAIAPNLARTLPKAARTAAGSLASAAKAAAEIPLAESAETPAARCSSFRATIATEKPSAPNFSATAVEIPVPNPTMTMVFDMVAPMLLSDDRVTALAVPRVSG
jgi:hypothetical protein